MKKLYLNLLLCGLSLFPVLLWGAGKDSIQVLSRPEQYLYAPEKFFTAVYNNPATHFFAHESSLTRLSIYSTYNKKNGTYLLQEGNGSQLFGAGVSSWLNLSGKTKVWGNANYITGKKRQIKWNETSDFELLYPYVMADTIGGDLQTEQYRFSGGYSGKGRLFTWGLQAAYRAKIEYRDRDPRPKNVVSDFNIEAGGSVHTGPLYILGVAGGIRIYNQDNVLDFYSPNGNVYIHTMTGLGTTYSRFTGDKTDVLYKGFGYQAGLQWLPVKGNGWRLTAQYDRLDIDRHLKSHNNLALTRLNDSRIKGSIGFRYYNGYHRSAVKATGLYMHRKGIENLFGNGTGNIYDQIGSRSPYLDKHIHSRFEGLYGQSYSNRFSWFLQPYAAIHQMNTTYSENQRQIKINRITYGVNAEIDKQYRKSFFQASFGTSYTQTGNSLLSLTGLDMQSTMGQMMQNNYDWLQANKIQTHAGIHWETKIKENWSIYAETNYKYIHYRNEGNYQHVEITCGVCF